MSNDSIPDKLLKPYDPTNEEVAIYKAWEESGYFHPEKMIEDGLLSCPSHSYNTYILSHEPLIIYIENFLSASEATHLLDIR